MTDLPQEHEWPRQWHGEWIGPKPVQFTSMPGPGATEPSPFGRHLYRGELQLSSVPATAHARVTADSRYALYVNGRLVGRGPVRSQPRRLHYDSYDLAPMLTTGVNRFVVLVTYYGMPNSFWQPATGTGNFGTCGVLLAEVDLDSRWFGTGDGWQVRDATAWSEPARTGLEGVPVERFDARLLESNWMDGTSGQWRPAQAQPVAHFGGLGRTRPPNDPVGPLRPRPIGPLGGDRVTPVRAAIGAAGPAPTTATVQESPVEHVLSGWAELATELAPIVPERVRFTTAEPSTRAVSFDFGRIVAGRVEFELAAPAGTVVDLLYREAPAPDEPEVGFSTPRIGARYIARGGDDAFTAGETNGLRVANLLISVPAGGDVELTGFAVIEDLYRQAGSASFHSSDPELDALYRAGIRTVELNSHDAYTDCPTREQRSWVGDGVVHQMVSLTTSSDWRMPLWYVELANSPRPDGILPMSVVGEIEHSQGLTIPDWSLYWVHGVYNVYRYTGNVTALSAAMPTARRVLEWFVPYLCDGVLSDVPEWGLIDWSSIFLDGASSILTAFWAAELREYAQISDFLGNAADAAWARAMYEQAQAGFDVFYDEARGTYVDHRLDGVAQPAASQLAGALAIISGLAPVERVERVLAWIGDPARHVTRSWIGGGGTYDAERVRNHLRGIRPIDWDAQQQTVVAEPFAAFLVHDAYAAAGRPDLLIASMRRWSEFLQDGYDTFGECWGWGTHVHGWSSTPTRDIVQVVLGVTPAEPGFTRARVAPAYHAVESMHGSVPTPFGDLVVDVAGERVEVNSPVPFTLVRPDGSSVSGDPGTTRFAG
jgi:hypothetical protein